MKLQYKLALTAFFAGFLTLFVLAFMIYISDRVFALREYEERMEGDIRLKAYLIEQRMLDKTEVVVELASEPPLVTRVLRITDKMQSMEQSARERLISRRERLWRASDENSVFVRSYLNNPVANRLKAVQNLFPGFYGEIFVTDRYGALVGSTGKLTTYRHGHKYWWKGSFDRGKGRTYYDDRGFDESVRGYVVGIVVPIRSRDRVVGILKANINMLSLFSENLSGGNSKDAPVISLVREGGEVVYREGWEPLSQRIGERLQKEISSPDHGSGIIEERGPGKRYLTAYRHVNLPVAGVKSQYGGRERSVDHRGGNTNEPWYVVESIDFESILSGTYGKLRVLLILGFVVTVAIGISAWPLAARMEAMIRQRNDELRSALEVAEKASRAKSMFLASMSHELRTPLNAILGYARILKENPALEARVREKLSIIERSGEHLLMLINDVLDLSRIEAGKIEIDPGEVNLRNFFEEIVHIFEMRCNQKGIRFYYESRMSPSSEDSPGFPLMVLLDARRLRQVLFNLLSNSAKFTDRGHVTLRLTYFRDSLLVDVEDTGRGIPGDQIKAIFEPFQQVAYEKKEEKEGGTGLGLTISQKLVELMGGELRVESTPGLGSVFSFEIPLKIVNYAGDSTSFQPLWRETRKITGYEGDRKSILVVDDLRANRLVVADTLKPLGFEIAKAEDGMEAVQRALTDEPDIIIMDMRMPGMDGIEATKLIRKHDGAKRPVIFAFSASVFLRQRESALEAGCDAFLAKPLVMSELYDAFREHCGIRWIEEETEKFDDSAPFLRPVPEDLVGMLKDLRSGDLKGVREGLRRLREKNPELEPFCLQAEELLNNFKIRDLTRFFEP